MEECLLSVPLLNSLQEVRVKGVLSAFAPIVRMAVKALAKIIFSNMQSLIIDFDATWSHPNPIPYPNPNPNPTGDANPTES